MQANYINELTLKKMKKLLLLAGVFASTSILAQTIQLTEVGSYTDGREEACEVSAYDVETEQIFVTNAAGNTIDIIDVSIIATPSLVSSIDVNLYGGGVNSVVALNNGYFAAAIEDTLKQANGRIVFFRTNGTYANSVEVGALPDMVTVNKDGSKVLVANEGEPDAAYVLDPNGSVSIINIAGGIDNLTQNDVTTLGFENAPAEIAGSLSKPGTPFTQDLEPEYIAINDDNTLAAVSCQESNVFIFIDLTADSIIAYKGLGFKDFSLEGNGFDASDKDGVINIKPHNVKGVYQPDAIASYTVGNATYFLSANEGDGRDYDGYSSETRIKDLILDPTAFPNAAILQSDTVLGRLKTFTMDVIGDTDSDNDVDELYAYGARSFSIWDENGNLVWDSGDDFEQYIASNFPNFFNCNDGLAEEQDKRSDDKGIEPEAITVGEIDGEYYAFVGLERQGGIMIYNITNPLAPVFVDYKHAFDLNLGTSVHAAPEGILFVPAAESHTGKNLLIASHELSGTIAIYEVESVNAISEQSNNSRDINIYPNPGKSRTTLVAVAPSYYEVKTLTGVLIEKGEMDTTKNLSLSNYASGLYLVSITAKNDSFMQTLKLVVE